MKPWEIDVAVMIIFFVRDDTLQKVFDSVKVARPRKLLLWQDGPRKGRPDDLQGIMKCRKIVENIDWDCEVIKNYATENRGVYKNIGLGAKWVFEREPEAIFLEDDCLPDITFFSYCTTA